LIQTAATLEKTARRLKSPAAATAAATLQQQLRLAGRLRQEADEAASVLENDAGDLEANYRAAVYHSAIAQDWDRALTFLARSDRPELAAASAALLKDRNDAVAQLALADAWWQTAEKTSDETLAGAFREVAGYWYRQFLPRANAQQAATVRARLAQLRTPPRLPGLLPCRCKVWRAWPA
jgi:hypothetical protein